MYIYCICVCSATCSVLPLVTFAAGHPGRPVGGPGRGLAPSHAGRHGDAEQVDGVGLQVLQAVLCGVAGQVHSGDVRDRRCAVGQPVRGHPAPAQLVRQRLPAHLDVAGVPAAQAQLRGPQGHCSDKPAQKPPLTKFIHFRLI